MNLGIFLPNWIGDAVMATPALRAVRAHHGAKTRIVGIGRPLVAELLAGTNWFDEFIPFDPRSLQPALRGVAFLLRLRRRRLDTALLLTNSLRSALFALLAGARQRVGFVRNGRGPLLTHKLHAPTQNGRLVPTPVLRSYLQLAQAIGCVCPSARLELATLPADERAADGVWSRMGLPPAARVVVLNSGGAYGPAKLWPTPYFSELARRIAVQHGRRVLVLCGPGERRIAREIVRGADHPHVTSLADERVSIGLSKACVRRSALVVTTDSGPRHMAAAFGVPAITLFGPTHIDWSENGHPLAVHLQLDLDCVPCQRRACPLGHHACMRRLSVDMVLNAVSKELARRPEAFAA
jgi:heptosyltransferase-2